MFSRNLLTTVERVVAVPLALLLLSGLTACRTREEPQPRFASFKGGPAETEHPAKAKKSVTYSANHDVGIKAIMDLAGVGRWEQAGEKAEALRAVAPEDVMVKRV